MKQSTSLFPYWFGITVFFPSSFVSCLGQFLPTLQAKLDGNGISVGLTLPNETVYTMLRVRKMWDSNPRAVLPT